VEVKAATIADALASLTDPTQNCASTFIPRRETARFVNLYLNDEDIRYLPAKEATSVSATDTLSIIPSIAGGC